MSTSLVGGAAGSLIAQSQWRNSGERVGLAMAMSEAFVSISAHTERPRTGDGFIPAVHPPVSRRETADFTRVRSRLARCFEIDCLRHILPPATLAAAELRAAETGVGADRFLIAAGHISEDAYALAFAHWLNIPFEPLDARRRLDCPFDADGLIAAGAVVPPGLEVPDGMLVMGVPGKVARPVTEKDFHYMRWLTGH